MKKVLQYIIALILSLVIIAFLTIKIFSSTILNENYIISKLDKEDYYEKIYEEVKANFENYINQSGLDEEVLNDIITKEKIKQDTEKILHNVFLGSNEKISVDEIKENLSENIDKSVDRSLTTSEQKAVDSFIETICGEYKSTISNTKYENDIYSVFNKINKYLSLANKVMLLAIAICVILIVILSIKHIYEIFAVIGVTLTTSGLLLIITRLYITSKVRIGDITILNNPVSIVLRSILTEIVNTINKYGIIFLILGIALIIIYAITKSVKERNKIKEQYTPEN